MRITLRLDRVTLLAVTLFEVEDDEDELADMVADQLPFGFVAAPESASDPDWFEDDPDGP